VLSYTLANGAVLSQTNNGITNYLLPDAQNSTRAVTDVSGNITSNYDYDAFGNLQGTPTLETNYLYTAQQYDAVSELYSLRARYYDPSIGRFLSRDTWAYDYQNPVELNRYVYVANNPVTWTDPSGNIAGTDYGISLTAVGGGLVGGGGLLICAVAAPCRSFAAEKIQDIFDALGGAFSSAYRSLSSSNTTSSGSASSNGDVAAPTAPPVAAPKAPVVESYTPLDKLNIEVVEPHPANNQIPQPQSTIPVPPIPTAVATATATKEGCNPTDVIAWIAANPQNQSPAPPQSTDEYRYQQFVAGPTEYRVSGDGTSVWADGIDIATCKLIDAKYVRDAEKSFRVLDSKSSQRMRPEFRAQLVKRDNDLFERYGIVLRSQDNPFVGLQVITNEQRSTSYWQQFIWQHWIPNSQIIVREWTP
jgi:RHS repeat-associated protein